VSAVAMQCRAPGERKKLEKLAVTGIGVMLRGSERRICEMVTSGTVGLSHKFGLWLVKVSLPHFAVGRRTCR
jgi:hypothetical protein